jgi:hypothetical protein
MLTMSVAQILQFSRPGSSIENKCVKPQQDGDADDYESFWNAYGKALKIDIKELRKKLEQPWIGSEEGFPLEWHFEKLTDSGFETAECFWRCDCDAIYGSIRWSDKCLET